MFKYSVIIPHKDCPDLLSRCVNSIPIRDDIEIIVVDDCSNDIESVRSLEKENADRKVSFVYTTDKKGAGFARNQGLKIASGKWLLFADSDDYFSKEAFDCFDRYVETDADVIVFKHRSVFSDTGEETKRSDSRNTYIDSFLQSPDAKSEAKLRYCNDVPWAKMVRREMVEERKIQFDEVPASNDTMFSLMAGYYAKRILADSNVVYCVTVRQGSITKTKSVERYYSDHCVALRKNQFVRKIGHPECQEIIFSRILIVTKAYGLKQMFRFLNEVKKYHGQLFYGLSQKFGIR